MNRRRFFGSIVAAIVGSATFKRWDAWSSPVTIPTIPVDPKIAAINAIMRQHRQTIIDAFASDSYLANAMDIQDSPIYDSFATKPTGSFAKYMQRESEIS